MKWSKVDVVRLVSLKQDGFSAGLISEQLGVTRNAVIGKLSRLGLTGPCYHRYPRYAHPRRARKPPRQLRERFAVAVKERPEWKRKELAEHLGCSYNTVCTMARESGLLKNRLTEEQVRSILHDNRTQKAIASDYGVTFGAIGHIKQGRTWAYLSWP